MAELMFKVILVLIFYSCQYGSAKKANPELCPTDPVKYEFEHIKSLDTIKSIQHVGVTIEDPSETHETRVLVGRVAPECNPNFRNYQTCLKVAASQFDCKSLVSSHVVVQSTQPIKSINVISSPMALPDSAAEKDQLDRYMKQKDEWITEISAEVPDINLFSWPGLLKLFGAEAFPISKIGSEIFIAGSTLGKGRMIIINLRDILNYPDKNIRFLDNLSRWASKGSASSIKQAKLLSETNLADVESSELLLWKADNKIGEMEMDTLLQRVKLGNGLIVVMNSYYYDRDIKAIENSEIYRFLLQFGIFATKDYINQASEERKEIDWEYMRKYKSVVYQLRLMSKSLPEFRSGMETWLELTEKIPGLYDDEIQELYNNFSPLLEDSVACQFKTVSDPLKMDLLRIFSRLFASILMKNLDLKAPGVFAYPGDLQERTILKKVTMKFVCHEEYEILQTGYYLPPGKTLRATILSSSTKSWRFWINYNLFDVTNKPYFNKYPYAFSGSPSWHDKTIELHSGIGGLVWFQCGTVGQEATAVIENVVEAPMLNIRDPKSISAWSTRQNADAPMATVAGDSVVFAVPSNAIRNQPELISALRLYDKCIKNQVYLGGENFQTKSREVIASDNQIKAGWMHSGYPIGIFVEVANPAYENFIFNATKQSKEGMWGLYHELGHNRQNRLWTSKITTEITNNIFAALCDDVVPGRAVWSGQNSWLDYNNWQYTRMKPYLEGTIDEAARNWGDGSWTTLAVYLQVQGSFGWELYRQVFRHYLDLPHSTKARLSSNPNAIHDYFFEQLSRFSNSNLAPMFRFWRAKISKETLQAVSHLPAFFPDDFMTQTVPEVTERIVAEFPGVSRVPAKVKEVVGPLSIDTNTIQGIQQIFVEKVEEMEKYAQPQARCWSRTAN